MHLILPKCTLFFRNAPDSRKNAPCFQKCTRLSKKCTPLFQKCTLKNQKCTRAFSLGAFFYQNRCTKPTERQGYVPTQIIEKREILTVRVSLSHFYPTLIRQLPSHFCFKTLLWVLAQAPPLPFLVVRACSQPAFPVLSPESGMIRFPDNHGFPGKICVRQGR